MNRASREFEGSGAHGAAVTVPVWLVGVVTSLLVAVLVVAGVLVYVVTAASAVAQGGSVAIRQLEQQVAEGGGTDEILRLGIAYQSAGRLDDALQSFRRVLLSDPGNVSAKYHAGMVLLEQGDKKQAEEVLWEVLEARHGDAMAAKALGEMYAEDGHFRSLLFAVEPAVREHPEMADLQFLVGLAYDELGRPSDAAVAYQLALKYDPNLVDARNSLERLGSTPQ